MINNHNSEINPPPYPKAEVVRTINVRELGALTEPQAATLIGLVEDKEYTFKQLRTYQGFPIGSIETLDTKVIGYIGYYTFSLVNCNRPDYSEHHSQLETLYQQAVTQKQVDPKFLKKTVKPKTIKNQRPKKMKSSTTPKSPTRKK